MNRKGAIQARFGSSPAHLGLQGYAGVFAVGCAPLALHTAVQEIAAVNLRHAARRSCEGWQLLAQDCRKNRPILSTIRSYSRKWSAAFTHAATACTSYTSYGHGCWVRSCAGGFRREVLSARAYHAAMCAIRMQPSQCAAMRQYPSAYPSAARYLRAACCAQSGAPADRAHLWTSPAGGPTPGPAARLPAAACAGPSASSVDGKYATCVALAAHLIACPVRCLKLCWAEFHFQCGCDP